MLHDFVDGIYSLDYRHRSEVSATASGLAIIRDSRIIGSDPAGGLFEGHLAADPETGVPQFSGTMSLPPGSELITGLAAGAEGMDLQLIAHADAQDGGLHFTASIAGETLEVNVTYVGPLPSPAARRRMARSS
jgi:hypothetical protein